MRLLFLGLFLAYLAFVIGMLGHALLLHLRYDERPEAAVDAGYIVVLVGLAWFAAGQALS